MYFHRLKPVFFCLAVLLVFSSATQAATERFEIQYLAQIKPGEGVAAVRIELEGEALPRKLVLHLDQERHHQVESSDPLAVSDGKAIWKPEGGKASLTYQFKIDEQKSSGSYDSRIVDDWAILRADKLIPPISATMRSGLRSRAYLKLEMPEGWSAALPYKEVSEHRFRIKDPGRRFKRPKGWMIVGEFGSRQDIIAGVSARVAGPLGQDIRRQDTLAFLNWNLPYVVKVFPEFPERLLVVMAGDPMWLGGLSGTRSLFMHADRPLISGNRTSSMIHELVHVATGIRGDGESDWIVEGLAEFYALEILRRSGGISEDRYDEALKGLEKWGRESKTLFKKRSSGATTARAATIIAAADREIREATDDNASIDDVARALAEERGKVTLVQFRRLAEEAAGRPVKALSQENLTGAEQ
ncbi:hypothetical protein AWR36_004080 [Microbulbifer flavimaris]|uniref:Peptidase MA-like domain-containing protein n=1 Tax=Microbulbifer flavimaris TaxID=1781068 RepID=A0ABX4I3D4_9GAMM|nr:MULTISPECIES: hypothetical protein [Microbulbifer]KUJ84826.1 hypothetical protein AVO43_04080 [Microbulbifer sp. ZGT114]PCO06924.1 hypothetical protein AWR36_004080 [Microbulbifer flavimaris]